MSTENSLGDCSWGLEKVAWYFEEISTTYTDSVGIEPSRRHKMSKLKAAGLKGDANALLAMQYSYVGSRLLWRLNDNTIIMDELAIAQAELDGLVAKYDLNLNVDDYEESILKQFWVCVVYLSGAKIF